MTTKQAEAKQSKKTKPPKEKASRGAETAATPSPEWTEETINATQLKLDEDLQMRAEPVSEQEYVETLESKDGEWPFPPITCVEIRGKKHVVDGFTRARAALEYARRSGNTYAVPIRWRKATLAQALDLAFGSNAEHGYRRTNADKRKAVTVALAKRPNLSAEEIAGLCRVSHTFVYKVRAKLANPELEGAEPSEEQVAQAARDHESAAAAEKQDEADRLEEIRRQATEYGTCPVCGSERWSEGDDGVSCAACLHPHGEAAGLSGDEGEDEYQSSEPSPAARSLASELEASAGEALGEVRAKNPSEPKPSDLMLNLKAKGLAEVSADIGRIIRKLDGLGLFEVFEPELTAFKKKLIAESSKCQNQASGAE